MSSLNKKVALVTISVGDHMQKACFKGLVQHLTMAWNLGGLVFLPSNPPLPSASFSPSPQPHREHLFQLSQPMGHSGGIYLGRWACCLLSQDPAHMDQGGWIPLKLAVVFLLVLWSFVSLKPNGDKEQGRCRAASHPDSSVAETCSRSTLQISSTCSRYLHSGVAFVAPKLTRGKLPDPSGQKKKKNPKSVTLAWT